MNRYYQFGVGNYLIPINEFNRVSDEVMRYLKANRNWYLIYLSADDGYVENYWCVTNFDLI